MHIFVGSKNPVKINAVTTAAAETWPDASIVGFDVPSGVLAQPIGDEMTRQGAVNRAKAALDKGLITHPGITVALGVGLEGGVVDLGDEMWSTVWVAVVDTEGYVAESNGARFLVPEIVADQIRAGEEMGPIVAQLVGEADVRTKQGFIGVLTQGFVDRTEEYYGIAKMSLGIWYGRKWQEGLATI
jgi:inosine/xanthosine triphosphatase